MADTTPPKRSTSLATLSFIIGIAALIGFFVLNRLMAPPFPNFAPKSSTNSPATNQTPAK